MWEGHLNQFKNQHTQQPFEGRMESEIEIEIRTLTINELCKTAGWDVSVKEEYKG
jgi:hypothetical protein